MEMGLDNGHDEFGDNYSIEYAGQDENSGDQK